ncbi:MAG: hypothetical protein LBP38_03925 [Desulfovibrio sp.]|jgi:hypothetical protein|nr:hypothetical protein [Desulfovibrio sp.]
MPDRLELSQKAKPRARVFFIALALFACAAAAGGGLLFFSLEPAGDLLKAGQSPTESRTGQTAPPAAPPSVPALPSAVPPAAPALLSAAPPALPQLSSAPPAAPPAPAVAFPPSAPASPSAAPPAAEAYSDPGAANAEESASAGSGSSSPGESGNIRASGPVVILPAAPETAEPAPAVAPADQGVPGAGKDEGAPAGRTTAETAAGTVSGEPRSARSSSDVAGSGPDASLNGSGVILYSRAKPVDETASAVRGAVERAALDKPGNAPVGGSDDSVVTPAVIDELARFLADNYWPEGSLPIGRGHGATASLRLAGLRFGNVAQKPQDADPARGRRRLLNYVLMPSMIHALYGLYGDRFSAALEREALNRQRGPQGKAFTNAQVAAFFRDYAAVARGLSGVIHAYLGDPRIVGLLEIYTRAADEASTAYLRYEESTRSGADRSGAAETYQEAVSRRELRRSDVAAALRRGGNTQGLDTDSLVYAASWLYRRGGSVNRALSALEEVCASGAARLDALAERYNSLPREATAQSGNR